jgi:hypothetical protein
MGRPCHPQAIGFTRCRHRASSIRGSGRHRPQQSDRLVQAISGQDGDWPPVHTFAGLSVRLRELPPTPSVAAASPLAGLPAGPGLIDFQRTSAHRRGVQFLNRLQTFFAVGHFHKPEASRAPGELIRNDLHRLYCAICRKHFPEVVLDRVIVQVSNIDVDTHSQKSFQRSHSEAKIECGGGTRELSLSGIHREDWEVRKSSPRAPSSSSVISCITPVILIGSQGERKPVAPRYVPMNFALVKPCQRRSTPLIQSPTHEGHRLVRKTVSPHLFSEKWGERAKVRRSPERVSHGMRLTIEEIRFPPPGVHGCQKASPDYRSESETAPDTP